MVQYLLAQPPVPQDQLQDDMSSSYQRTVASTSTHQVEEENSELSLGNEKQQEDPKEDPSESPSEEEDPEPLLSWNEGGEQGTANSMTPLWNGAVGLRISALRPHRGTLRKTYTGRSLDQKLAGKAPEKPLTPPQNSLHRKRVYTCKRCHSSDIECIRDQQNSSKRRKLDGTTHRKCRACGCHKVAKRSATKRATLPIKPEFVATVNSSSIESDVECLEQKKIKLEASSSKSKASNLNDSVVVPSPPSGPPLEDSIDHFGKYMTSLLRRVPAKRALRLQKEVISIVLEDQIRSSDSSD